MTSSRFMPSTEDLVDAGFICAMSGIALYSFRSSFGEVSFMAVAMAAVVIGIWVAHFAERLRLDPLVTTAAAFVAYVLVVATFALDEKATAGFLPSLETMTAALKSLVTGWKRLLTTSPPVGAHTGLSIIPAVCGTVVGAAGYSVARRTRSAWLALLPIYATLALGILCGLEQPVSTLLHGAILTVVALTWMSMRHHRARPVVNHRPRSARALATAGMLVAIAIAGVVVGPRLPMVNAQDRVVWRSELHPPFDPSQYPSPLNGYRRYLKSLKEQELFTISGVPAGTPIRLATLDSYDGLVWRVTGKATGTSGLFERVGEKTSADFDGEDAQVHVVILPGFPTGSVWIPTVGEVTSIRFGGPRADDLTDAYRYNRGTDAAALSIGLRAGDEYWMDVVLPPSREQIDSNRRYELLPQPKQDVEELGKVIAFGADKAGTSGDVGDRVDRALSIADYFVTKGFYNDPELEDNVLPSGHGAARLERFVDAKSLVGDAEQYAATAGLVLVSQEIPARVVMGFVQPEDKGAEDPITGYDAEAWVEIPVADVGWVPLTVTPPRNKLENKPQEEQKQPPKRPTQVPPPPVNIVPDVPVEPAAGPVAERSRTDAQRDALLGTSGSGSGVAMVTALAGGPVLVVASTCTAILLLKQRRRRRRTSSGLPNQRIAAGWRELVDAFRDMGKPLPKVATRAELAAFSGLPVTALARRADCAVFGPGEPSDDEVAAYWHEMDSTLRSIYREMPFGDRWKARLSLTSLLTKES